MIPWFWTSLPPDTCPSNFFLGYVIDIPYAYKLKVEQQLSLRRRFALQAIISRTSGTQMNSVPPVSQYLRSFGVLRHSSGGTPEPATLKFFVKKRLDKCWSQKSTKPDSLQRSTTSLNLTTFEELNEYRLSETAVPWLPIANGTVEVSLGTSDQKTSYETV